VGDGVVGGGYEPASSRFGSYLVSQLVQRTISSSVQTKESMSSSPQRGQDQAGETLSPSFGLMRPLVVAMGSKSA
jgi:hypothetical protein